MIKKKLGIIAVLCILICAALAVLFLDKVETYKFKEDAIYYSIGIEYPIDKGSVAKIDTSKNVTIETKYGDTFESQSLPVYFKNSKKLILMEDLALYNPSFSSSMNKNKVKAFTEITLNTDTDYVEFTKNNKTNDINTGFLYDGYNTYIFLEDTIVQFNSHSIKVSAFSYLKFERDNWIQLFNYENDTFYYENIETDIIAKTADYSINVLNNVVSMGNKDFIMPSNVSILSNLFAGE